MIQSRDSIPNIVKLPINGMVFPTGEISTENTPRYAQRLVYSPEGHRGDGKCRDKRIKHEADASLLMQVSLGCCALADDWDSAPVSCMHAATVTSIPKMASTGMSKRTGIARRSDDAYCFS
ncbi:hypothetical protein VFPPC_17959 [Pochonia chlamydosporia 170]|uniref:Uncharacterized protein n=1 Tax=Pochonia chlamydosporia 170 TaxID=1380566 RepID=A0A219APW5_METCM|nr:hypothetical protein VFPPC_17959 [Pochonia chlamydosporia 170]OWT42848.1 hypothetical protein VFPPC_17959 [Pochonia chlamydosporia 170]